jgi:anthranilate/para-aminobenzoate synthase component I
MRTIRTKIYKFEELTHEGQNKAISENSDINVDHNWWSGVYEDAKQIDLKLTDFDLHQNNRVNGHFLMHAYSCAKKIIAEHGKNCKTYQLAEMYLGFYKEALILHSDGTDLEYIKEGEESYFDEYIEDKSEQFLKDLLNEYENLLRQDFEYRQSEEAIKETLISNDYEFLINGKIY